MNEVNEFISIVESRSDENKKSIELLFEANLISNCISILREELDSFIRVIYLGKSDMPERMRLITQFLEGNEMKIENNKGKMCRLTDRKMVDIADESFGYVDYVYRFGCSFIHLSTSHDYRNQDPFDRLVYSDKKNIIDYLNSYHGYPLTSDLTIDNFQPYILKVFNKISSNMLNHLKELTEDRILHF